MSIRVEVERSRCEGYGFCEQSAPEVFLLNDEGELVILQDELPSDMEARAEAAIRLCPVAALRLTR